MHLTIGITNTSSHYSNYPRWIKGGDTSIKILQLQHGNLDDLKLCDGIVLSGGIDTHPTFYNNKRIDYPNAPNQFDAARDEFEISIFKYALEHTIPVLAICRGMQLVNSALGGDLIQDIEEIGKPDHRREGESDRLHEIKVLKDSFLYEITETENGIVNSAHHQAIRIIADDLIVSAFSKDGVAEAAEWKNKNNKPFLLCVQWHPERLVSPVKENPFEKNIRKEFLNAVKNTNHSLD